MKKILLLILFLSFIGPTHANLLTDFFFPKLEKFNKCIDNLEKQNIDNSHKLCTEKYGKEIDKSFIAKDNGVAWSTGAFRIEIDNTSLDLTIKAVHIKGYFKCKDESKCKKQYFDVTKYVSISPGKKEEITFSQHSEMSEIDLPDEIAKGDWSWGISRREFIGFKVDY